ncbi:MAG TPA: hypothetical protein VHK06_07875 [Candidatus Limnocylindria bacterium]|nr:hypothetical protein [Candidatus Limnocylindria bacterium]
MRLAEVRWDKEGANAATVKSPERARLQIRAVLVAYRAEVGRLARSELSDEQRAAALDGLRGRSVEILDLVRDALDGSADWHPELLRELAEARSEVESSEPTRSPLDSADR